MANSQGHCKRIRLAIEAELNKMHEAFPWDTAPRYLLRDRGGVYGEKFREAATWLRIREVFTAPQSPWQNA
jgi:putative transposase